jgi:hypothetical protein
VPEASLRAPISAPQPTATPPPPAPESEDDDESLEVPKGKICRRKACGVSYEGDGREGEKCVYHPGAPIFHEGSKGYTCCKRRVLEFDEFMKIEGCKTKDRHLFVGSGKKKGGAAGGEELLETVRYVHFYPYRMEVWSTDFGYYIQTRLLPDANNSNCLIFPQENKQKYSTSRLRREDTLP